MSRGVSASRFRGLAVGVLLATILGVFAGAPGRSSIAAQDLYLEVYVNGQPSNLIIRVTPTGEGGLLADAEDLREVGVSPDPLARAGEVRLDRLPGVVARIDHTTQVLHIDASETARAPRIVSAAPAPGPEERPEVDAGSGLVLNYNLTAERRSGQGVSGPSTFFAGDFDARLFLPKGALNHGFTHARQDGRGRLRYRRLDSYWRSAFPGPALQVQVGDLTTRGPNWARPVRLGGILLERNFALRPDLVTIPLPDFEGSAAVPTTVEVYSGALRRFATQVPAGPFALTDLPFGTGAGEARVILRDVTGRETQVDLPFLVSADLLRKGMADYALAAGHPRLGIGTDSDRYGSGLYGVATLRYGLTDGLTLMGHAEAGEGLRMGGMGATLRIGTLGTASLSLAQSSAPAGSGTLGELSGRFALGEAWLSGRMMRRWGEFYDVARISAEGAAAPLTQSISELDTLSLALPLGGANDASASLFYARAERSGGSREESLGLSYTRQFAGSTSLNLSALAVDGDDPDTVFGLGVHVPLGARHHASVRVDQRDGRLHSTFTASGHSKDRETGWDWRIQAVRNAYDSVHARAGKRFDHGRIDVAARASDSEHSVGLRADGALVVAGGGLFLSRRVDDAFAVVDAGAPGVEVAFQNRPVGKTGPGGKLLVPGLRSYETSAVSIDPASLPIDADIPNTHQVVRPAFRNGVKLDFGIDPNPASALVELLTPAGTPVEVGLQATMAATGEPFLVGYDGLVYVTGLSARNSWTVRSRYGSTCTETFNYKDEPGTIARVQGVICE